MKNELKTATVRARIEPKIKERAELVLSKLGLTSSEAISVFYHKIVSEQGIPFSMHLLNKESETTISRAKKDIKNVSFKKKKKWKNSVRSN